MEECESCKFNNPKATVTAVIIRDGKLLLLKRNEEPHRGMLDLPGGYMQAGEMPEGALKRELSEELNVVPELTFIGTFPGTAQWKKKTHAILSHVFLADIGEQKMSLNDENEIFTFISLKDLDPTEVAFDSNQDIARFVKNKFGHLDAQAITRLLLQLDSTAEFKEQRIYKGLLNGYLATRFLDGKMIGMGWIFIRQTALRKQAVVEDVIVDETHRQKGLGKDIMKELMDYARSENVEVIELTSGSHRIAANELYKKMGFIFHPTNHYLIKL